MGRAGDALKHYEIYLERAKALAEKVPVHALWQRNWAIAHQRLGDALLVRNEPEKARDQFQACLRVPVNHPVVDAANPEPRDVAGHCRRRVEEIEVRAR